MRTKVETWLKEGRIDIFIGLKATCGHVIPCCVTRGNLDEVKELIVSEVDYPLEKIAARLATGHPDLKIGLLLTRACHARAVQVLQIWNQLTPDHVELLDVSAEAAAAESPSAAGPCKLQEGLESAMNPADMEKFSQEERFRRWMYEFSKCIKCYGCRNICPVCFCRECSLEHKDLVATGSLPPEIPIFHLIRAVHMAGRCIDCGLCEAACPADIPLRLLYRKVNEIVSAVFHYETGTAAGLPPFSVLGDEPALSPRAMKGGD
jgi:formate dehydrogenase (coenzyme F420) beta subunit